MKKKLIGIGIILILIAGAWLWYGYDRPIHEGWQTFESKELGLSIQHPADMEIRTNADKSAALIYRGSTQTDGTEIFDGISMTFMLDTLGDGGLSKYIERSMDQAKTIGSISKPLTPITVAEVSGFTYTAQTLGEYDIIFLPVGDDKVFVVTHIEPDPQQKGYQQTVTDMLSTLEI